MMTFNVNQDDRLLTMTFDLTMMLIPDLGEREEGMSNSSKTKDDNRCEI